MRSEFQLGHEEEIFVAFSGGLDSTVLLHALASIDSIAKVRITALHVNHGLNHRASDWERHCGKVCAEWGVSMKSCRLGLAEQQQAVTEANARDARYDWLGSQMSSGSVLMTAHHSNDNVETILANLFRGSGVRGLAGIRKSRTLARGSLWRPLLGVMREEIAGYAGEHGLRWIEDPANADCAYTRNHLRHRVLPVIREKWCRVDRAILRGAENCLDASDLLDQLAESDLAGVRHRRQGRFDMVSISDLNRIGPHRIANALRMLFVRRGYELPSRQRLLNLTAMLIDRQPEPTCLVTWPGTEVRRYRDWLYLSPKTESQTIPVVEWCVDWNDPLVIDHLRLTAIPVLGCGIKRSVVEASSITVRPRQGGERCRMPGSPHHKKLKKIYQENGVPPWLRDEIPLLYVRDGLAGIPGVCYFPPFAAVKKEPGVVFELLDAADSSK